MQVLKYLSVALSKIKANFDLSDNDKILRIEGSNVSNDLVVGILNSMGYQCEVLE